MLFLCYGILSPFNNIFEALNLLLIIFLCSTYVAEIQHHDIRLLSRIQSSD
jgi:hypothetical protein